MLQKISACLILILLMTGCQSTLMKKSSEQILTNKTNGNAQIVFMRSAFLAKGIQASLFNVTSGEPEFIGILSNDTKIAYQAPPGEHMFMVVGESADFLKATVTENTYYAVITPRMGFWKARFSMFPVRNDSSSKFQYQTKDFEDMTNDSMFVEKDDKAEKWAKANAKSITKKLNKYLPEWKTKGVDKQREATINPEDHL